MAKAKLYLIAVAIGAITVFTSDAAFLLITGRPVWSEWDVYLGRILIASCPFILLAAKNVVDRIAWFLGVILTAAFWGNFALQGIRYQLSDAGGGVDFAAIFLLFASPAIISPICFVTAKIRRDGFRNRWTDYKAFLRLTAIYGSVSLLICFVLLPVLSLPMFLLRSGEKPIPEKIAADTAGPSDRTGDAAFLNGRFRLMTLAQEADNRCLESNRVSPTSYLGGATFMDKCQNVSGQLWKGISAGNDTFHLTSLFLERDKMCLEGSVPFKVGDRLKGAARMESCTDSPGQLWSVEKYVDGYIQLTNSSKRKSKRCLAGSTPEKIDDPLKGAARMEPCDNSADQLWRAIPQD